jgi:hypothetical protein
VEPCAPCEGARAERTVASDEVEAIEVDVLEMKVGTDVMVEQGQLDAQLYYIGLSEVLAIAARMRSVEQCWLLMAEWDSYSDGLCRACAPHTRGPSQHLSSQNRVPPPL